MHDFGEYIPRDAVIFDGRRGDEFHNAFPVLSAKAAHDLLEKERAGGLPVLRALRLHRAPSAYVPAVWGGDAEATFDETQGLPSAVRGGLNLSMSGVPYWGSDITGFKCLTDRRATRRCSCAGSSSARVSPIMMEQNACANPLGKKDKWKLWNDAGDHRRLRRDTRASTRGCPVLPRARHRGARHGQADHHAPVPAAPARAGGLGRRGARTTSGPALYASPVVRRGADDEDDVAPARASFVDLDDYDAVRRGRGGRPPGAAREAPTLARRRRDRPHARPTIDTLAPSPGAEVVGPEDVADRLDVLVALSPGKTARIVLDGTELAARRKTSAGPASGLAAVTAAQIAMCDGKRADEGCFVVGDEGGVSRLRVTTPLAVASTIAHDDVELTAKGPSARRVRWDVLRVR